MMTEAEAAQRLEKLIERYRGPGGCWLFVKECIRPAIISRDQEAVLRAIEPNSRLSIVSGTTVGKTALISWVIIWFVCCHAMGKCIVTSTEYDQVLKTIWPEVRLWTANLPDAWKTLFTITSERIFLGPRLKDLCFASPETAAKENVAAYQGKHGKNFIMLFDEAAGIANEIFDAARGSFSTPGAIWICTGNGNYASGDFYETHHKNAAYWKTFSFSSLDSPFVSQNYCKEMAEEFGVDSNMYRIRVLGLFPKHDPDTLIPFDWVQQAKERDIKPAETLPRIAGLDPNGGGNDRVGFCVRQGTVARDFMFWQYADTMQTVGRVMELYKARLFDKLAIDVIGVGTGVADRLVELGVPVIPVNAGSRMTMNPTKFKMLRDEMWWEARKWFESAIVRVEAGKHGDEKALLRFMHEVSTPKWKGESTGHTVIESKDSLRKADRLGHSPDIADAFCLTFAQGIPTKTARQFSKTIEQPGYVW